MPASTSPRCRSKEKEPIAIIGIGARLPGGITGPASLWAALLEGRDAISEVPRDRWNIDAYYDPDRQKAGKICSKRGGFIEGMARFDAGFFGIYPKVAERMDPRQRHLLEVAYEAIEDAGLLLDQLWGSNTAVTVGVFLGDEIRKNAGSVPEAIGPHTAMGAADTTVSARLAFNFNLRGPTFSVDTACSSSLVAVHLACSAIWAGDADMALSGGVNIMADPGHSIELSKGGFLSPEGLCRAFDAQGDGYVRGEGAGVVVLKPLRQAKADGDRIYAVIRNTVVNSDGHTPEGLTVPNEGAQIAMLRKAYDDVGLCPADVDYVEAHGTGTRVGDPAETAAFGAVYAQGRPAHRPLIIGSIKTNIGHTEAVAGVAGLIKLALALHHRQIPKNLHFETPNPAIDFDRWKLRVPVASAPWPASTGPALGGVNSFGAGGTNAHAILEAHAPAPPSAHPSAPSPRRTDGPVTLEVSAKSEAALKALAEAYAGFFRQTPHTLGQIAQAIRAQRTRFPHRLLVSARAKDEAREALEAYVRDAPDDRRSTGHLDDDDAPKIAFVCSGQGPQWYAMGRQLMATSALFNETLTIIDALFEARAGYSLLREMTQPADASRIGETRIAQPAIMAMQIGLIHMWRELGVTAQGFVGHSIGEVAAAYGAGALTLEQAVDVIYNRAKEQDKASGAGVMLAVGLTREAAAQALQGLEHRISIAAVNGPEMSILSGDKPPIDALAKELEGRGVFTKYLRVNVPFHSHHMEPLEDSMLAGLAHLEPQEAALPLYSTVTGRRESGRHLTARYWYHNVRDTVRFTTAVSAMLDDGYDAFVEIAPHPVLGGNIADLLAAAGRTASVVVSARRDIPRFEAGEPYEIDVFVKAARQLSLLHVPIDWSVLNGRHEVGFVDLPRYPWQHADLWMETDAHRARRLGAPPHPFLGVSKVSAVDSAIGIHDLNLDHRVHLYLQEHQIENAAIVPATAQLEASVAVGRRLFGDAFSHLDDLRFERALFVPAPDQPPHEMRLEVFAEDGRYGIFSRAGEREPWQRHGGGRMVWGDAAHGVDAPPLEPLKQRIASPSSPADFYERLRSQGLQYGPRFRLVSALYRDGDEILAALDLREDDRFDLQRHVLLPTLADAALHVILSRPDDGLYLPSAFARWAVFGEATPRMWSYVKVTRCDGAQLEGDVFLYSDACIPIAAMMGIRCGYVQGSRGESDDAYDDTYAHRWSPAEAALARIDLGASHRPASATAPQILLVGDEDPALMDQLRARGARVSLLGGHDVKDALRTGNGVDTVVYLAPAPGSRDDDRTEASPMAEATSILEALLALAQALIAVDFTGTLCLVSRGAATVSELDGPVNLAHSVLYGPGRVLRNEQPQLSLRLIDVRDGSDPAQRAQLAEEILVHGPTLGQAEVALRPYGRYARALFEIDRATGEGEGARRLAAPDAPWTAEPGDAGAEAPLRYRRRPVYAAEADDVVIAVDHAGLTPEDARRALGSPPQGEEPAGIGRQCVGQVCQLGRSVEDLALGDTVVALSPGALAGRLAVKAHRVCRVPEGLSPAAAAAWIMPYTTAHVALRSLCPLRAGDTWVIQDADRGVGRAAARIAAARGARVIAIRGPETPEGALADLAAEVIPDGDPWTVRAAVMDRTEGRGADALLTGLSPGSGPQSLDLVADFGAFLDLAIDRDQAAKARLGQATLQRHIAYHAVDVDRLFTQRPGLGSRALRGATAFLEGIANDDLAATTDRLENVNAILGSLANEAASAAVAVQIDGTIDTLPPRKLQLDPEGTYLMTGGASGLGLEIARWFADRGATRLALVSRSGPKSPSDRETIDRLRTRGVEVRLFEADVCRRGAIEDIVAQIQASAKPLKGIVHSAGLLRDASINNMTRAQCRAVFEPKAIGAWNLHQATLGIELDVFLLISSVSSILGIPGQFNYAAANGALNHLALHRQALGLAASSAALGLLGTYAGMSADEPEVIALLDRQGLLPMGRDDVMAKLEALIVSGVPCRMLARTRWDRWGQSFPHARQDDRLRHIMETARGDARPGPAQENLRDALVAASPAAQRAQLVATLTGVFEDTLGASLSDFSTAKAISRLGLDSLMFNQIRSWIQVNLSVNVPLLTFVKGPSIEALAEAILTQLADGAGQRDASPSADTSGISDSDALEVSADRWFARPRQASGDRDPRVRIFCMHPVGAGASMFLPYMLDAPEGIEIIAIQQPGRENRRHEPAYQELTALVRDLARRIEPLMDRPCLFWGHSWGGMVMFELLKHLRVTDIKTYETVMRLVVTGTIAPQLITGWKERSAIKETAVRANSVDKILSTVRYLERESEALLRAILPVMREDMGQIMRYRYREARPLSVPITAFGALEDEVVTVAELAQWRAQTAADFELHEVHGDHWFLSRNKDFILKTIVSAAFATTA